MWKRCQDKLQPMMPECVSGNEMLFMNILHIPVRDICTNAVYINITWLSFITGHKGHGVLPKNKLPWICSLYYVSIKVLSMKISYLTSLKHVTEVCP
jgi:hypothetical protein